MRKARLACLAAAALRIAGAAVRRRGSGLSAGVAFPEGDAERPAGRAHEPRRAARRSRPAQRPHGRDPDPQPADRAEHDGGRHAGEPRRALPARRGGRPGHRARPEVRRTTAGSTSTTRRGSTPRSTTPPPAAPSTRATRRSTSRPPEDRERLELFKGHLLLSRFKLVGSELDFDSEQQILEVPVDRGICCHVGGKIDFDGEGNLYLSTGDDTNPFESDGYSPIDERDTRNPAFDAQRTSANTNDLRGKILRIRVTSGRRLLDPGREPVPPGHGANTRPEIYAMGFRNPFRMAVDKKSEQRLRRRLLARRGRGRSGARPRRATAAGCSSTGPATMAGRTA